MNATGPRALSVLVVDSDDDTRATYVQAFVAAGWQTAEAESGPIALAKALAAVPDVIVSELRLVGMDGYELIEILKRDPDTAQTPVIVVCGEAFPGSLDRARASGADVVITKPCLPEALIAQAASLVPARGEGLLRRSSLDRARGATAAADRGLSTATCPACGRAMIYAQAHTTQVGRRTEQWIHYRCPHGCGSFEYRQRTRKLRRMS